MERHRLAEKVNCTTKKTAIRFHSNGLLLFHFSITKLPIVVKGILRPDDAELAVQHGVSAIGVSNHGGRQLDGVQATVHFA